MRNRFIRVLALAMLLALVVGTLPAMAATKKAKIVPEKLYVDSFYGYNVRFEDMPEDAKIVSVKSSNTKVLQAEDTWLTPKKPGTSKITVKYKVGRKSYTISAKYTVAKYYKAVKSVTVNGRKAVLKEDFNKLYYRYTDFEHTKFKINLKPASGWKIEKIKGYYVGEYREDLISETFIPKNNKTFKVAKNKGAYVVYTLRNAKTKKSFDYCVGIMRVGE